MENCSVDLSICTTIDTKSTCFLLGIREKERMVAKQRPKEYAHMCFDITW